MTGPVHLAARIGDRDLAGLLSTGDLEAAITQVYSYVLHRCGGDRQVAEDLTQETFFAAVAHHRDGAGPLTVSWLITVARNKLFDHLRRLAREERKLRLVWSAATERSPALGVGAPAAEVTQLALEDLSTHHRSVLLLHYVDRVPVAEVAGHLGKSVAATESLLARARRAFRAAYLRYADA